MHSARGYTSFGGVDISVIVGDCPVGRVGPLSQKIKDATNKVVIGKTKDEEDEKYWRKALMDLRYQNMILENVMYLTRINKEGQKVSEILDVILRMLENEITKKK